ncbi:MAG TPA: NUDIX hydrolase [Microthrixaceae bacterium]|nr:NUDIX hydrolase [Microthrixaceae bacterium]
MTHRRVVVDGVVRAAGGVVCRPGPDGTEVLVVHRPRRHDWSFPKGHLQPGENDQTAALREVEEETGHRCRPVRELGETRYLVDGRPKAVRYWLMHPDLGPDGSASDGCPDGDEVDETRWIPVIDALDLLTHALDRDLLSAAGLESS